MQVSEENHTKSVKKSQSTYKTDAKSLFTVTKDDRDELARAAFEDGDKPAERLLSCWVVCRACTRCAGLTLG